MRTRNPVQVQEKQKEKENDGQKRTDTFTHAAEPRIKVPAPFLRALAGL